MVTTKIRHIALDKLVPHPGNPEPDEPDELRQAGSEYRADRPV